MTFVVRVSPFALIKRSRAKTRETQVVNREFLLWQKHQHGSAQRRLQNIVQELKTDAHSAVEAGVLCVILVFVEFVFVNTQTRV